MNSFGQLFYDCPYLAVSTVHISSLTASTLKTISAHKKLFSMQNTQKAQEMQNITETSQMHKKIIP